MSVITTVSVLLRHRALVGDITPHDNITKVEKHALEEARYNSCARRHEETTEPTSSQNAFKSLLEPLAGTPAQEELWSLWNEYEAAASPEAVYVKQLDRLEMITQGIVYENANTGPDRRPEVQLESFFTSTPLSLFPTPHLREVAEAVHAARTTTSPTESKPTE